MENWIQQRGYGKTSAVGAMLAALALSACGGGGKGGADAADASMKVEAASGSNSAAIKVEGTSTSLSSDLKTLNVVTPPVTWGADGAFPPGTVRLTGRGYSPSALKEYAPGVYTKLPWGAQDLSLSTGTVTDIAGNGQFAIGRWTAGSDSSGHTYNINQGRTWAVGAPVDVKLPLTGTNCTLVAATRPTASDGNTAPGVLKGATAIVAGMRNSVGLIENRGALTLQYSIGGDLDQTFSTVTPLGSMYTSRASRSSLYTTFLGPDASKPYLVVSYGVHAPTVGLINGMAVLSCL
ncbi:hypothetical protein AB1286_05325 [Trinickia sp. NRRL B-1857]|uniref:hypothetical protein n=1 Tax=Trinickia sp. NRRL B-1857 TaxID=3162879 RepID=UPI003D2E2156